MPEKFEKRKGLLAGFCHLFAALSYSLQGLVAGFRLSLAFRQECFVFLLLCFLLYVFEKPHYVWLISLTLWVLVMVMELINTAMEESLDLISKDYSPVIKVAKDMASAAVFLLVMVNVLAQLSFFYDDFIAIIEQLLHLFGLAEN